MIIEISAVFKIQSKEDKDEIMFAKPTVSYEVRDHNVTSQQQYDALKQTVANSLPNSYIVLDATKEEINQYNEDN